MNKIIFAAATLLSCVACTGNKQEIEVSNDSQIDRTEEMISIDAASLKVASPGAFRILDADGKEIPYQLTYDNHIIFPASIKAGSSAVYTVTAGSPAVIDTLVWGRQFPERKDDMAWENDRSAYRAYGPALQRSGERAFGYDIWTKSVSRPVLEKRFALDRNEGISFHVDHGEGMDVYAVGPTLGGGTTALLDSLGNIVYPYCYQNYDILDNGPLRFTVRLDYGPVTVDGDTAVIEHRLISLDRGSWLNRTEVNYEGLSHIAKLTPGIVVHKQNPQGYTLGEGYMSYADSTENAANGNGVIFVGVVSPESKDYMYQQLTEPTGDAIGHILAPTDYENGKTFTYYWGSGWSKGGMPDTDTWNAYLKAFSESLKSPLKVTVK